MNVPIHIITEEILPFLGRDIVTCYRCMRVCKEMYMFISLCKQSLTYSDLVDLHVMNGSDVEITDHYLSRALEYKSLKFVDISHVLKIIENLHLKRSCIFFPDRTMIMNNSECIIRDHLIEHRS